VRAETGQATGGGSVSGVDFKEFRRGEVCPICEHPGPDRCKNNGKAVLCFRVSDEIVNGHQRIKRNGECSTYVPAEAFVDRNAKTNDGTDLDATAKRYASEIAPDQVQTLAVSLGVSGESLRLLGVGSDGTDICFPERDATGHVIGLCRRYADGNKRVLKGQHRGLVYPTTQPDGNVLIVCEGTSDAAALLTMGIPTIARSSAGALAGLLAERLRDHDGEIIVVGDADNAGRNGASNIAAALTSAWSRPVPWTVTPAKDVRAFLRQYDGDPIDAGRKLLADLQANKKQAEPEPDGEHSLDRITEMFFAERLIDEHKDELRFASEMGWLYYDGKRWKRDPLSMVVQRLAKQVVRAAYADLASIVDPRERRKAFGRLTSFEAANRVRGILFLAQSDSRIGISADALDQDPWLLNVQNGTIDLKTFTLRPHSPDDLITKIAGVAYDADAKVDASRWVRFLVEIFGDDASGKEVADFMQRATGYSLTGIATEQCYFLMHGSGSNGKTTFIHAIMSVLGDYARQAEPQTFMAKYGDAVRNDIARLVGVRFLATTEVAEGRTLAENLVKTVTGGDIVVARFLFKEFFEYVPQFKLFIAANNKPRIKSEDHATWRRIRLIPFERTMFSREDATAPEGATTIDESLPQTLVAEGAVILKWMLAGCRAWQEGGLRSPTVVKAATEAYRADENIVSKFVAECCEAGEFRTSFGDLFIAFAEHSKDPGEKYPMTRRTFGLRLTSLGFDAAKSGRTAVRSGLRLLSTGDGK